jgi:hypothetical protein
VAAGLRKEAAALQGPCARITGAREQRRPRGDGLKISTEQSAIALAAVPQQGRASPTRLALCSTVALRYRRSRAPSPLQPCLDHAPLQHSRRQEVPTPPLPSRSGSGHPDASPLKVRYKTNSPHCSLSIPPLPKTSRATNRREFELQCPQVSIGADLELSQFSPWNLRSFAFMSLPV